jgi:hypothetical protein
MHCPENCGETDSQVSEEGHPLCSLIRIEYLSLRDGTVRRACAA